MPKRWGVCSHLLLSCRVARHMQHAIISCYKVSWVWVMILEPHFSCGGLDIQRQGVKMLWMISFVVSIWLIWKTKKQPLPWKKKSNSTNNVRGKIISWTLVRKDFEGVMLPMLDHHWELRMVCHQFYCCEMFDTSGRLVLVELWYKCYEPPKLCRHWWSY